MKVLSGRDLADFIKERQSIQSSSLPRPAHLLIIRDNSNPVISKYVDLKIHYGEDIGIKVTDYLAPSLKDVSERISAANSDPLVDAIIVQLPLSDPSATDSICNLISPEKDVDGLGSNASYDSATATAILWLLAGYDIELENKKIAIIGRGKLVGSPLYRIFTASNYDVSLFHRGDDLTKLKNFDIIISATGVPGLILNDFISPGTILIDAGTASENGIIKGDLSPEIYTRKDLTAITPIKGGVGPLTVSCLFDHVLQAALKSI